MKKKIQVLYSHKNLFIRTPDDLLYATNSTEGKLLEEFDKYGDSFTEDLTVDSLKKVFKRIPDEVSFKCNLFIILFLLSFFFPPEGALILWNIYGFILLKYIY